MADPTREVIDLPWEAIREQLVEEQNLVTLPRSAITVTDVRDLLMRHRVMSAAINQGQDVNAAVRSRLFLLQRQLLNIRIEVIESLAEAEADYRISIFKQIEITIINMDPTTLSDLQQQQFLVLWRLMMEPIDSENIVDIVVIRMHIWIGVALIRSEIFFTELLTDLEHADVIHITAGALFLISAMLTSRAHADGELQGLRDTFHHIVETHDQLGISRRGIDLELRDDDLRDLELRREVVSTLYPPVPLDSIAAEDRNCQICGENYGTAHDDKDECQPVQSLCCPPNIFGNTCLMQWFIDSGKSSCPKCRKDWSLELSTASLQAEQGEA